MIFKLLADAIVLIHLAFILFVALGGLLVLKWKRLAWLHIPAAIWGAAIELFGCYCPLTPLEIRLRQASGQEGYEGGFIEHYLIPIIYPDDFTRATQIMLGVLVAVINGSIYAVLYYQYRQHRQ